jgi:predicted cobalt transporter CbtA
VCQSLIVRTTFAFVWTYLDSSNTKGNRPVGHGSVGLALLGTGLVIISADRLIDAWQAGQTWRVALYAVVSLAAIVATAYSILRGGRD